MRTYDFYNTDSVRWCGFKIVGDNIDKNVHLRFQTLEASTKSLHYFHSYAVKDRIDFSHLSDKPPIVPELIDVKKLLPDKESNEKLLKVFKILTER